MKVLVLTTLLVGVCLSHPLFDDHLDEVWNSFKKHHAKTYSGVAEESGRRLIFEKNVAYIHKHNLEADLGKHTHRLGINQYADLTDEEYHTRMKGFIPRVNHTDKYPVFLPPANMDAPQEVDWRKEGYVTPVKNQERCGSCWAFSATGSLEGQHFKKTGRLVSLSEQNLIDCSTREGNKGCKGGIMDNAFKYIKMNGGIDTEESYPYKAREGMCHFEREDVGATDTGFMDIRHGDEEALMMAVASVGPISVAMDASQKDLRFYKTGVYSNYHCSSTKLDHGVLAVGYGEEMGEKYWLIKNSWGESWGDMGYLKIRRDHGNMCGIATQASYPLV